MNSSDIPNDSRGNRRIISDEEAIEALFMVANEVDNRDLPLGFQNHDVEMEERKSTDSDDYEAYLANWQRQWAEEQAARQRRRHYEVSRNYNVARNFALQLHSDQNLKIVEKTEEEEVVIRDEEKSEFQRAKESIKKRREDLSTTSDMMIDPMTVLRKAPTLVELSARVLAQNIVAIKSLKLVPDHLRKKLSYLVSGFGKVDTRLMELLIEDSPSEICAKNCVELKEDDLLKIFCDCDRVSLKVLILDLCGRAMTDYTINEFFKRAPNGFPSLTTLSLQGAFCLTDNALLLISNSSPLLQFINLTECSLLTYRALKILADKFGSSLRGLSIGGCQGIKWYKGFSSSLYKFEKLNYLSVAGLDSVNDGVVRTFFTFRSSNLTDLSLANCNEVTDDCIWHIGRYCKKLEALDITDLDKLTDKALEFIAEGCKYLRSLKLTSNGFSDEGIAAFLEVSGDSLNELCLNKVRNVGPHTAFSLAEVCKRLQFLDLSWCRRLTQEDLRRILRCCTSLRSLKLFGWTQVDDTFLEELSRSHVHITGLKMTSLYAHLDNFYPSVAGSSRPMMGRFTTSWKLLAISLSVLAVLSPLYIDRLSEEDLEEEEELFGFMFSLSLLLLLLILAIVLSLYCDPSLTRFDPYWIHRLCGSFGGLLVILILLVFVLICKASD
ncbi:Leucine-rich repeat cysteine-containing subtype [Arabidopsis thaliana x Arabidopsis arenosa]|uniref:Leucine-rich repeat cysteine-containing subtype n=1 Tax=Arabidopsis thaliana x Arabidopsis arenosa TaxID=1240361 RepID=A0A8T1Z0H3_9BRAS|nr:Leucine-rich repeat cysteine-containing subtype [Arabidopsis thaliana x Arabidopsis arenosa]